jgi:hypothetical protein
MPGDDSRGNQFSLDLDEPVEVSADKQYEIVISLPENVDYGMNFFDTLGVTLDKGDDRSPNLCSKLPMCWPTAIIMILLLPPNGIHN